jgi:hypothetical protein
LVRVTNSFYSYGLPSGSSKFSIYARKAVSDDENLMSQKERPPKPQFVDFQIIQKMIYLCKMTNQLRANESQREILTELEAALLSFCVSYKNHVLTDSRLILLGS